MDLMSIFPVEINEKIFNHLKVKDLLTASTVSSKWNSFIAKSKRLMEKIVVKVSCNANHYLSNETLGALAKSERIYESIIIERCAECMNSVIPLLSSGKTWKHVTVRNACFLNAPQAQQFFACIQETVEYLDLFNVFVRHPYSDGRSKGFTFPKLKVLKTNNVQSFMFPEMLKKITTVEEFTIISNNQTVSSLNAVLEFLSRNNDLKVLEIAGSAFNQLMYHEIADFSNFHLEKLTVTGNYFLDDIFRTIHTNLTIFMLKHAESLTSFTMGAYMGCEIIMCAYELPKLQSLTLKGLSSIYDFVDWDKLKINPNPSLKKLTIPQMPDDLRVLKALLTASPNVYCLSISVINNHVIDLIDRNLKKLICLNVGYLNVSDKIGNKGILKNIEQMHAENYSMILLELCDSDDNNSDEDNFASKLQSIMEENADKFKDI
jgi:F-box-like